MKDAECQSQLTGNLIFHGYTQVFAVDITMRNQCKKILQNLYLLTWSEIQSGQIG